MVQDFALSITRINRVTGVDEAVWRMRRLMKRGIWSKKLHDPKICWKSGRVRSGNVRNGVVYQTTVPRKASSSFQNSKMRGMTLGSGNFPAALLRHVAFEGVHLAETAAIPGHVVFFQQRP
jgi:hypothetical protein